MLKYEDDSYALYPKTGSGRNFETKENVCDGKQWKDIDGIIETPHGFVRAYATYYENSYEQSRLEIIKDGRVHHRLFRKFLTRKTLVTKAKQFANELFG